jgi:hypothetical protein
MNEAVFALVVFLAVLIVLFGVYPEVVLAGALFLVIWQFAQFLGPSPLFTAYVLIIAACIRLVMEWVSTGSVSLGHKLSVLRLLDAALTRQEETRERDEQQRRIWNDRTDDTEEDFRRS